jgi:uncharacterized protein (DUF2141 family)
MKKEILFLLALALVVAACATISSPTGGPKDEQPPRLVRSSPDSAQRNFQGKTIELTFDEMLQLNNPKEEIIITPSLGKQTKFKLKDERVTIEPELPFRENSTYTISFREGIKDATEGNVAEDLRLAFSTGPDLDTLFISGTLKDALLEKIPENITVAIYQADTFNIFQHTPEYFTKSNNKTGTYRITNLKEGTYRIYAFQDKNKNLKIESQSESFGFISEPFQLQGNLSNVDISLARVDSRPLRLTTIRTIADVNTIRFNKPVVDYRITGPRPVLTTFGTTQSEVIAYYPTTPETPGLDSISVSLTATDSLQQKIDTAVYIKKTERDKIEETFTVSATDPEFNADTNELAFTLSYNKPIKAFLPDSIFILSDTATIVPISLANARMDTVRKQIHYLHKLQLRDSLIAPLLRIGKGTLISIDNDSSKASSRNINVLNPQNTATLLFQIDTEEPNYIVEVIDSQNKVVASAINNPNPVFRYLKPQTLKLRVIIDTNANGKWDTVNYLTNTQAERVIYYLNSEKKTEIPLRANWEVGPNTIKF